MSAIVRIDVRIDTGKISGAGTDGDVFIAIGGREFHLDSAVDDFEFGSQRTYTLGQAPNINYAGYNNPNSPPLDTVDLDIFPVWIRFEPAGGSPDWNLAYVLATVNPGPGQIQFSALEGDKTNLWLGQNFGKFCFLKKKLSE